MLVMYPTEVSSYALFFDSSTLPPVTAKRPITQYPKGPVPVVHHYSAKISVLRRALFPSHLHPRELEEAFPRPVLA
jgi:hypothetical protein